MGKGRSSLIHGTERNDTLFHGTERVRSAYFGRKTMQGFPYHLTDYKSISASVRMCSICSLQHAAAAVLLTVQVSLTARELQVIAWGGTRLEWACVWLVYQLNTDRGVGVA